MTPITFTRAIQPARFSADLIAAFPALQTVRPDGLADVHFGLEPLGGDEWRLTFDAGITLDPAAVQTVIAAHDGTTPWPADVQREADALDLSEFRDNWLQGAQLLGRNNATGQWAAAGNQWDALTPAQRTMFMRRVLQALGVLARRT